jgi:aldehyde:ferredoxin oxidoreductase
MAEMKFNLLEIDLTTKKHKVVDVTQDMQMYLGGRGLGAKLLWDRVPQGADPLKPENILYFGVGPITGFLGSVTNVSAKSPLTMLRGQSNMNGHFSFELICAGYNAGLLLTGESDKPVYIFINNEHVDIMDAAHLWGKLNIETQQMLRKEIREELNDQRFAVASIGPAGEKLVRNSSVCHDFYHHAARLGMGAVMGSKKVKAVVVKGTRPPKYINPEKAFAMLKTFFHEGRDFKVRDRRFGHTVTMPRRYYAATEGIKNKQLGWHAICDLSNPLRLEQQYKVWNDGCIGCHVGCKVPYMRREPPFGPCVGELRHDNAGGWNANVMVPGYDTQVYLTPFVDNLGIDSEDVSGVVAWMMECYERGLVSKEMLDGIDLTWGNLEAICKLLLKIARREGIGNILAEGLRMAPDKIGKDSKKYAIESKGVAITSYELRGSLYDALGMATNPCGALHHARALPHRVALDSLTTCLFLEGTIPKVFGSLANYAIGMLNATSGWELTEEDWKNLLQRATLMERCYSIREGYVPARDDIIPDRFFEETIYTKYGEAKILSRSEFLEQREKWYTDLGLSKEGIPKKELLHRLKMDFTVSTLEETLDQRI